MKKEYSTPEMTNLGEVMELTKGTGGFGWNDFLRLDLFCDDDSATHPFAQNPLATS
ncbi:MAG: lasso peptide [Spirochaetaceae bacterium]|nr:lasso peptide [Spirochaetaceae bacterium]